MRRVQKIFLNVHWSVLFCGSYFLRLGGRFLCSIYPSFIALDLYTLCT